MTDSILLSYQRAFVRRRVALILGLLSGVPAATAVAQGSVRYAVDRQSVVDGTSEELSHVSSIRAIPSGGVSITEFGQSVIRLYGSNGRAGALIGGRGSGPGEFRMITDHGWIGDSLWVFDRQLRRTTIFHRNGNLLGTLSWPSHITGKATNGNILQVSELPVPVRQLRGGYSLMAVSFERTSPVTAGLPMGTEYALFKVTSTGSIAGLTHTANGRRACEMAWSDGDLSGALPIPYCPHNILAVSPTGERVVFAEQGGRFSDGRLRLLVKDSRGEIRADVSLALPVAQIPSRLMDAEIKKLVARSPLAGSSRGPSEAIERMPRAQVFPAFGQLIISDDSEVWLQRWTPSGVPVWVSVRPEVGRAITSLQLPPTFQPATLVPGGAWGTLVDPDGVPSVAFVSRQ